MSHFSRQHVVAKTHLQDEQLSNFNVKMDSKSINISILSDAPADVASVQVSLCKTLQRCSFRYGSSCAI